MKKNYNACKVIVTQIKYLKNRNDHPYSCIFTFNPTLQTTIWDVNDEYYVKTK